MNLSTARTDFEPILPGATIGVLGSGQLGRMFAIAARRLGYRVHTFSPDSDTPTGQVADREVTASYDDLSAVREFASQVSVVTFEFENVPAATAEAAGALVPVRPSGQVLHITQHRLREKTFLSQSGFPVTPFRRVTTLAELESALAEFGAPAILKTAGWGYDGKGQVRINRLDEAGSAWSKLATDEAVLEAFVDFSAEASVVAVRGRGGECVSFPMIENSHSRHILDLSVCPARVPARVQQEGEAMARRVLESLDVVGVLCVEYFVGRDGQLLINELAPRPHNSGHLTIDACLSCQFEQQVRSICGLPLGSVEQVRPAAMANLLGDLWFPKPPNWIAACQDPRVKLHLYGKAEARPGRKMGHLTALADSVEEAVLQAQVARRRLGE
ncbi:MAG: 5-(carboxyamino)imidazole ribonucleotide synthase [Planctomycetaceae bacterium]|jgi:5-(carboxyamino)imidazole ribonucleotide synthase